jgi:hypothetical protein
VQFYESTAAEAAAIQRAAAGVGCRVELLHVQGARLGMLEGRTRISDGGPAQLVGRLRCVDGWAAARLLVALAAEDARTPGARAFARQLRHRWPSDRDFAAGLHSWVKRHVRFVREHGEIFQSGAMTINEGAGDCDDHARLVYALAVAGGLDAAIGILHRGDASGPAHATAQLVLGGVPVWAETTVDARLGEEPNAAAKRLGLSRSRTDIAQEVVTMVDGKQIALDAEALQLLGYLSDDRTACSYVDRSDPELTPAVAAFQSAHAPLVVDGLLGPKTRARIADALRVSGVEGFDYTASIGALGDAAAPVAVVATRDLSDDFLLAVHAMAQRFQSRGASVTAEDFLRVWMFESGISSHRPNGAGAPYGGLNQMGLSEQAATGFKLGMREWLALSNEAQLPYVEQFYAQAVERLARGQWSVLRDATAAYVATFAPAHLIAASKDSDFHLYDAKTTPGQYAGNKGLDFARKGYITPADLARAVAGFDTNTGPNGVRWREVKARVTALGGGTPPRSGGAGLALAFLAAGGLAAYAAHWWATT